VLDLSWVVAGPSISRALADYGAVVVKVEPPAGRGVDSARYLIPQHGGVLESDSSVAFQTMNAGKLGISLDLRTDRELVERLVRWADLVVESFAPGTLDRLGLGWTELSRLNPQVVMLSTSISGATGRHSRLKGTGQIAGAIGGVEAMTGWPDRPPLGLPNAYTDILAPRIAVPAALAALRRSRATGVGAWVDVAQAEAGLEFLGPALESYLASGNVPTRAGNDDAGMAPHGVYPARPTGEHDSWVAITIADDDQFAALCDALGRPKWRADPRLATVAGRRAAADELNRAVSDWTARRTAGEAERLLQAAGVAAHAVLDSEGIAADPQVEADGQIVSVPHPVHGHTVVENSRYRLGRTPALVERSAPMFDQHRVEVLAILAAFEESADDPAAP
jgi:crotonobetainyl-CoA:carnitine CoA-transferase CaiB-like acyl-CoA transferase